MSRYVGPVGAEDDALMTRDKIDARIDQRIADFNIGVGGTGPGISPVYVRAVKYGAGNGTDWSNAFSIAQLAPAIAASAPGGVVHVLASDNYTGVADITIAEYATQHLTLPVTIQASDVNGDLVLPTAPAAYSSVADVANGWDAVAQNYDRSVLETALAVPDSADYINGLWLVGTRTPDPRVGDEQHRVPIPIGSWAEGAAMIRLGNGVAHLRFRGIGFRDVGNGAFRVTGEVTDVEFVDIAVRNAYRWIEVDTAGALVDSTLRRWDCRGSGRGGRIRGASRNVDIVDIYADEAMQTGLNFPTGLAIDHTAADITVRGEERMAVLCRAFDVDPSYWNGDGVSTESGNTNITLRNLLVAKFTDGGVDMKSSGNTLDNLISYDCKRGVRLWGGGVYNDPIWVVSPRKRGGGGGACGVGSFGQTIGGLSTFGDLHIDMPESTGAVLLTVDNGQIHVAGGSIKYADDGALTSVENSAAAATVASAVSTVTVPRVAVRPVEARGLAALAISPSEIAARWATVAYATSYEIEIDGNVNVSGVAAAHVVGGLTSDTVYVVRVRGANAGGSGEWSLPVECSTPGVPVATFSDDFAAAAALDNYEVAAGPEPWQISAARLRSAAGGNSLRVLSPVAVAGVDHSIAADLVGWDETTSPELRVRYTGATYIALAVTAAGLALLTEAGTVRSVQTAIVAPARLEIAVQGDLVRCKIDGVPVDWDGAGETVVAVAGQIGQRTAIKCGDDDLYVDNLVVAQVSDIPALPETQVWSESWPTAGPPTSGQDSPWTDVRAGGIVAGGSLAVASGGSTDPHGVARCDVDCATAMYTEARVVAMAYTNTKWADLWVRMSAVAETGYRLSAKRNGDNNSIAVERVVAGVVTQLASVSTGSMGGSLGPVLRVEAAPISEGIQIKVKRDGATILLHVDTAAPAGLGVRSGVGGLANSGSPVSIGACSGGTL